MLIFLGARETRVPGEKPAFVSFLSGDYFIFSVMYPRGLEKMLEADHHQKVTMTFSLRDISSGKLMTAHQV